MAERRTPPSTDLIYSEADVAEMRQSWELARKEEDRNRQLAEMKGKLEGMLTNLPDLVKAKVHEVLKDEKERSDNMRRNDFWRAAAVATGLLVLVVPLEDVFITWLTTGKP